MTGKPFPVSESTIPYWRSQELHSLDKHRSTDWPDSSDIVIVGGGYAGASLAYHIQEKGKHAESQPSITILEAREACSGATGRNGGHLKPDPFSRAGSVIDKYGKEAADEVSSFEIRHVKEIGDLVRRENIDCDFVVTRACDVCLYDEGRDVLKAKYDRLSDEGLSIVDDVFYSSEKTAEGVCVARYYLRSRLMSKGIRYQRSNRLLHPYCCSYMAVQACITLAQQGR